ncbi:hypothetical protein QBC35DRAFT_51275 [Podospora australis]|uniref:SWR1-complex protein 3 domain-containing protein n=1 Tax=Podospora australis TaxID=1536484 RepID=A0AAN6WMD9_9PEZI|nr:hypothetical protein QBC35DRAFT_51275 [Podospora australis]
MEKKRKLPARAAARVEQQAAKRRHISPQQKSKSSTPTPAPAPAPAPELPPAEEAPPPLPKSVTAGKPLPTVDSPQPSDLPNTEYQSVTESGVLSESLARSRNQWITDGIFQKYWTKPTKKRGVLIEEPNNPPKDSMMKLGQVTIVVEPHHFEATMYAVKDPKPPPPQPPTTQRPVLQYGPPNGVLPPPATPTSAQPKEEPSSATTPQPSETPAKSQMKPPSQPRTQAQSQHQASQPQTQPQQQPAQPHSQLPNVSNTSTPPLGLNSSVSKAHTQSSNAPPTAVPSQTTQTPLSVPSMPALANPTPTMTTPTLGTPTASTPPLQTPTLPPNIQRPVASPRGMESMLSPINVVPQPPRPTATAPLGIQPPRPSLPNAGILRPSVPPTVSSSAAPPSQVGTSSASAKPAVNGTRGPAAGAPAKGSGTDPIILLLAERAGSDANLRDLMKRVAQGEATKEQLERFQVIIDGLAEESKLKGSADRLLVDGRTVKYFANEVRAILDIVLTSNAKQTSADLRPPAGSDKLIVALVKAALDDIKIREMVRRIAEEKPQYSDATDLKATLERLRTQLIKEKEAQETKSPPSAVTPSTTKTNGAVIGAASSSSTPAAPTASQPQQALRSKGPPPPPPKPDISAIVFEFAGGSGDRYLFPKFSILENITMLPGSGQQIIASFIIVRRGSQSEYPQGDPDHDYYQPVTIRLFTHTGRHLEHIPRVVAPEEDVRTYMDNIMDTMTRGEYVLLAMRLPRRDGTETEDTEMGGTDTAKEQEVEQLNKEKEVQELVAPNGVLWATKPAKVEMSKARRPGVPKSSAPKERLREMEEDAQYQSFISKVTGNAQQAE